VHKNEPLVSEFSPFEFGISVEKLKLYKLPSSNQIPREVIKAGRETLCSEIHKFIHSIFGIKGGPPYIGFIYNKGDKTNYKLPRNISVINSKQFYPTIFAQD
jgi:hypothetical protein